MGPFDRVRKFGQGCLRDGLHGVAKNARDSSDCREDGLLKMPRIRTIKPEFWTDPLIVGLPILTRLFYIALWNYSDDSGCFWDEPDRMQMELMPKEQDFDAEFHLAILEGHDRIIRMETGGKVFWQIAHWHDHQKIDHPSKSRIIREDSRKLAIPQESRRRLALKYGCKPGGTVDATCYFCGAEGSIKWWTLSNGRPSGWVSFQHLEIDHFEPESLGGTADATNLVLSCRYCNRSRCDGDPISFALGSSVNPRETSRNFASPLSGKERKGKEEICDDSENSPKKTRFVKPSISEVEAYMEERGKVLAHDCQSQAEKFWNFHESKGWIIGKSPMKDWKAAVRTWEGNYRPTPEPIPTERWEPYRKPEYN